MTDEVTEPEDGNQDQIKAEDGKVEPSDAPDPLADLDAETREWFQKRHEGSVLKLAQQARELDKFAGNAVAVPKDDATPEELSKFFKRLGRPDEADGYQLTVPDSMPETMPYDEDAAKDFRGVAHTVGLNQKQAAALHDWFVERQIGAGKAAEGQVAENVKNAVENTNAKLTEAWGDRKGETFKANIELADKFFNAVDDDGALRADLQSHGLLGPDAEVLIPGLALAFAKAGALTFREGGTLTEGKGGLHGANPFEDGGNVTEAMRLAKSNPDQARMLAQAAGKDPREFGL